MIAMLGTNPFGKVLHLMIGPETDLFIDINGAALLDITPMLSSLSQDGKAYISLTRTKSEVITEQQMRSAGMSHVDQPLLPGAVPALREPEFGPNTPPEQDELQAAIQARMRQAMKQPVQKTAASSSDTRLVVKTGTCSYCGASETKLLPVPGHKICVLCTQIELGRKKKRK